MPKPDVAAETRQRQSVLAHPTDPTALTTLREECTAASFNPLEFDTGKNFGSPPEAACMGNIYFKNKGLYFFLAPNRLIFQALAAQVNALGTFLHSKA